MIIKIQLPTDKNLKAPRANAGNFGKHAATLIQLVSISPKLSVKNLQNNDLFHHKSPPALTISHYSIFLAVHCGSSIF